ncbi:zinc metalloprotease [Bacillus coahuilensis m2-6]|uniref:site-2 protease family protein n=1 Tax=Bacillus coahuilensis TaxID=408580 RepID=UPI0007506054|nr:zinc metalloprotease [Bacillus coahuilensis m2-6]
MQIKKKREECDHLSIFSGDFLANLPFLVIALVIGFTVHEYAHAYVAYKFGDSTSAKQGRLTLNPASHLDPIGTILILIAGFGWARPVPVNRFNLRRPRLHSILVSVAGPLSNFVVAFIATPFAILFMYFLGDSAVTTFFAQLFQTIVYLNVLLFVFNLIPLPPLDGYRIIEDLVSPDIRAKMSQYEIYGPIIFIVLIVTPIGDYTIWPFLQGGIRTISVAFYTFYDSIFLLFL